MNITIITDDLNDFLKVVEILVSEGYRYYSLNEKTQYSIEPHVLIKNIPTNGSINVVARALK